MRNVAEAALKQAIEVHQKNFEMLAGGLFYPWVEQSLDKLTVLMPGRYARNEISGGFMGSIDRYAYRMPLAPPPSLDPNNPAAEPGTEGPTQAPEVAAQVTE